MEFRREEPQGDKQRNHTTKYAWVVANGWMSQTNSQYGESLGWETTSLGAYQIVRAEVSGWRILKTWAPQAGLNVRGFRSSLSPPDAKLCTRHWRTKTSITKKNSTVRHLQKLLHWALGSSHVPISDSWSHDFCDIYWSRLLDVFPYIRTSRESCRFLSSHSHRV